MGQQKRFLDDEGVTTSVKVTRSLNDLWTNVSDNLKMTKADVLEMLLHEQGMRMGLMNTESLLSDRFTAIEYEENGTDNRRYQFLVILKMILEKMSEGDVLEIEAYANVLDSIVDLTQLKRDADAKRQRDSRDKRRGMDSLDVVCIDLSDTAGKSQIYNQVKSYPVKAVSEGETITPRRRGRPRKLES